MEELGNAAGLHGHFFFVLFSFRISEYLCGPPTAQSNASPCRREAMRALVDGGGFAVSLGQARGGKAITLSAHPMPCHQNRRLKHQPLGRAGGEAFEAGNSLRGKAVGSKSVNIHPAAAVAPRFSVSTAGRDITSLAQQLRGLGGKACLGLPRKSLGVIEQFASLSGPQSSNLQHEGL